MDDAKFQKISERGHSMLKALTLLPPEITGGSPMTYNAWIDDTEVVVLGFQMLNELGGVDTKPIAIFVHEELFHRLRVDYESSRVVGGTERPAKRRAQ